MDPDRSTLGQPPDAIAFTTCESEQPQEREPPAQIALEIPTEELAVAARVELRLVDLPVHPVHAAEAAARHQSESGARRIGRDVRIEREGVEPQLAVDARSRADAESNVIVAGDRRVRHDARPREAPDRCPHEPVRAARRGHLSLRGEARSIADRSDLPCRDREAESRIREREQRIRRDLVDAERETAPRVLRGLVRRAQAAPRYGIPLPDRQLACAPFGSPEGQRYFAAMQAAANFAWANRQTITHAVRGAFARVFGRDAERLGMRLVYDVAHNIAKVEEHSVEGRLVAVVVHRKGATRASPPGHVDVPERYRGVGQPVLIPGDMGRYSFLLAGTQRAMDETFGSVCHGAGRRQSRHAAKKALGKVNLVATLAAQGITVRVQSPGLLAEEASEAYKDVADVVDVCDGAGIARKVARTAPRGHQGLSTVSRSAAL
jgi:hypothetical protein